MKRFIIIHTFQQISLSSFYFFSDDEKKVQTFFSFLFFDLLSQVTYLQASFFVHFVQQSATFFAFIFFIFIFSPEIVLFFTYFGWHAVASVVAATEASHTVSSAPHAANTNLGITEWRTWEWSVWRIPIISDHFSIVGVFISQYCSCFQTVWTNLIRVTVAVDSCGMAISGVGKDCAESSPLWGPSRLKINGLNICDIKAL